MTTTHDLADIRATMTPEELAAIDDKDSADDADALKALADEGGEDEAEGDDAEGDGDAAEQAATEADSEGGETDSAKDDTKAAAPAAAEDAQKPAAPTVDDGDDVGPRPYAYTLPDDFKDQLQGHKAAVTELRRQRDEGEISNSEYDAKFDELSERGAELERMRVRADVSADQQKQYEQALVNAAWGRTLKAAEADGIDYRKDAEKHADFDGFIKALANKPENNDKPLAWFFQEAHKRVLALHGLQAPAQAAKPTESKPADPKAAAKAARAPDLGALPKDLAGVPGGLSAGDVGDDEFEEIDKLSGLEYEDALAKQAARDPNFMRKFTGNLRGNRAARH